MDKFYHGYVVILGMHNESIEMIYEAKELHLKVIGMDFNPNSPGFKHVDIPMLVSIRDSEAIINALKTLAVKIVGITALGVENQLVLTNVAKAFNLKSVGIEVAMNTTYKVRRYNKLKEAGINIPNFQMADDWFDVKMAFPFIIKPDDSSGSRGVYLIHNRDELKKYFYKSREFSRVHRVIVEEYLRQDYNTYNEVSIEGFMLKDKLYITGFADRNYIYTDNLFIENGSNTPSTLSDDIQKACKEEFEKAVRALGIDGPTKGDLIIKDGKVYVIEITSRLSGGGFCNKIQKLNNHTNIVKATVAWACDLDVEENWLLPTANNKVIHRFYLHDKKGIITKFNFDILNQVYNSYVNPSVKVGDKIEELEYINRIAYVIVSDDTGFVDLENQVKYLFGNCVLEIE